MSCLKARFKSNLTQILDFKIIIFLSFFLKINPLYRYAWSQGRIQEFVRGGGDTVHEQGPPSEYTLLHKTRFLSQM